MVSSLLSKVLRFPTYKISNMPFYAVAKGRAVGIYKTWPECESQVKGFPGARFKKFNGEKEAADFIKTESCRNNMSKSLQVPKLNSSSKRSYSVISSNVNNVTESSKRIKKSENNECDINNLDIIEQLQNLENRVDQITNNLAHKLNDNNANIAAKVSLDKFETDNEGYVQVYTDGACSSNGSTCAKAGLGVFWSLGHPLNTSKPVSGRATNNCGEIQAASCAIQQAIQNGIHKLSINTDSQFLINSVTKWMKGWKRNSWKLKSGQPVKNERDFKELDSLLQKKLISVKWNYVKAHEGIFGNEMADQLAKAGAAAYIL